MNCFPPNQIFSVVDYETFSECDLKKCGSFEYSKHPSTEILVVSWMTGTKKQLERKLRERVKARSWAPLRTWNRHRKDLRNGKEFAKMIKDPTIVKVAHNALFEQAITRNVLPRYKVVDVPRPFIIPYREWFCTAVQSAVHAMPRSLDGVTGALGLDHVKDKEGHRLMLQWSKPKKPSKKDPTTRQSDPQKFDRLVKYCEHDIYAEVGTFLALPELIPDERQLWVYDQEINFRGARVDRETVEKIIKMIAIEKKRMTAEIKRISDGQVQTGGQNAVILKWLARNKVKLPNLQAKTVDDAIKNPKTPDHCRELLKLRQSLNKTSLKKYPTFLNHTTSDSKMRFSLNFNATVHGRWGGAGVQPHNFPRGTLKWEMKWNENGEDRKKEYDLAVYAADLIANGADIEFMRSQFGDLMEVFVSCLRCMIVADPGYELYVSDFSAIEARVLFWLADHKDGMQAFVEKRKMYEELAMVIFNRTSISQVKKDERFVGKQAFLLSGYGGGWKKFQSTCEMFGQPVSVEVAKKAIDGYRKLHSPVPTLWTNLERSAILAVQNPGKTYKINKVEWFMSGKFLCCKLPSGRCLYYYGPQIKYENTPWGKKRPGLRHWTVDSKTRKWVLVKTWGGVLAQNCVGGISRDLLAASMVRVEKKNYPVILTVHDEIVSQRKKNTGGSIEEYEHLMKQTPNWATNCPVDVEGFISDRYRK